VLPLCWQTAVAAYMKYGLETSWYAAIGIAALIFIIMPFILSRIAAIYLIRRMERVAKQIEDRIWSLKEWRSFVASSSLPSRSSQSC
jgi:hypothetical protein